MRSFSPILCVALLAAERAFAAPQCPAQIPEDHQILDPNGGPGHLLGLSAAISGDRIALSAPWDPSRGSQSGSVSTFAWDGGAWIAEALVVGNDTTTGDMFGNSVDLDGDVLVVGAWRADAVAIDSGAAYVFRWDGATWVQEAKLIGSDSAAEDLYGSDVAVQGDKVVVGAWWHDTDGLTRAGKGYVYRRIGGVWTEVDTIQSSSPGATDRFGYAVDLDHDRAVVGAWLDSTLLHQSGAAYVFRETSPDSWTEEQKLLGSDVDPVAGLGFAVAIQGLTVAFGSHAENSPGYAFVYEHDGTEWVETARLAACDPVHRDRFGSAIDVSGDVVVVGAQRRDLGDALPGAAYRFVRDGSGWKLDAKLAHTPFEVDDNFGISVAADAGRVVIGADWSTVQGFRSGTGYVFDLAPGLGENYCEHGPNSTGQPATLTAHGSASIATADLSLRAYVVPPGKASLFFYGAGEAKLPFGDGFLCVSPFAPGLLRLPPIQDADEGGVCIYPVDFANLPPAGAITPGSTWHFQAWYRDPAGPGGTGTNLTNGLRITFEL